MDLTTVAVPIFKPPSGRRQHCRNHFGHKTLLPLDLAFFEEPIGCPIYRSGVQMACVLFNRKRGKATCRWSDRQIRSCYRPFFIFYFLVFNTKKKLLVDEILAYGIYIDEEWEEEERNTGYNKRMIEEIKHSYGYFCSRRQLKRCIVVQ